MELAAAAGLAVLAYRGIVDRLRRAPLALVARDDVLATIASPSAIRSVTRRSHRSPLAWPMVACTSWCVEACERVVRRHSST